MLLNMKTIKSILFYLIAGLFISCANDDDQTDLVSTLATFDYTDSSSNAIPDIIFANDLNGQLIAQINTNNLPGIYELKPEQGYASSTFNLSFYSEHSSGTEKNLGSYYDVPVNISIKPTQYNYTYSNQIKLNFNLSGTTNYLVNIYGLRSQFVDQTDDGLGMVSHTYNYDPQNSANKLFIKLRYTDGTGTQRYFYRWTEGYQSTDEITYELSDFAEVTLANPTLNDEANDYSGFDLYASLNGINCNLKAFGSSDYYNITEGFDNYVVRYYGGYTDDFAHEKMIASSTYPENITVTRPNWNINYSVDNDILTTETTGQYSLLFLRTSYENTSEDLNWNIAFPPQSKSYAIPELPIALETDFGQHFSNGSPFDQHYAPMTLYNNYSNYNNLVTDLINESIDYEGDEKFVKYF